MIMVVRVCGCKHLVCFSCSSIRTTDYNINTMKRVLCLKICLDEVSTKSGLKIGPSRFDFVYGLSKVHVC